MVRLLEELEVAALVDVAASANVGRDKRPLLFMGLAAHQGTCPILESARDQLQSDLMYLSEMHSTQHGGEPPAAKYLHNLERHLGSREGVLMVRRLRGLVLLRSVDAVEHSGALRARHSAAPAHGIAAQFLQISEHMVGDALARLADGRATIGDGLETDLAGFAEFFNRFLDDEAGIIFGPMAALKMDRDFRLRFQESQEPLADLLRHLFEEHRERLREFGHLTSVELTQALNRYFFGPILIKHFWTMLGIDSSTWDHRQHAQTFAKLFYKVEDD